MSLGPAEHAILQTEVRGSSEQASAALPAVETGASVDSQSIRSIRPLGEQIIIRSIPPESVGSIIVPDSAKRITHQGAEEGPGTGSDELQYVNRWLFEDITESLKRLSAGVLMSEADKELLKDLAMRANRSLLPKTEKGIIPSNGEGLNFVEAEVIAVGPGKRGKGDPTLIEEIVRAMQEARHLMYSKCDEVELILACSRTVSALVLRYETQDYRIPPLVKPGDRILYHPAVQKFDRKVDGLGEGDFYIIREESILAVIER